MFMIAFLFRLVGCLLLASGAVFAIGDIARSLSAETLRLTSVTEGAALLAGSGLIDIAGWASAPPPLGTVWQTVSLWPAAPTLGAIAILFLLAGRRRPEPEFYR
jgi:hypothetical protein